MKKTISIFLMMFGFFVSAQSTQKLFKQANDQYQIAAYNKAIAQYQSILSQGLVSSELYFNLGNAYYKTNQIAAAIYHYEKALLLNPNQTAAKVNLAYANRSIVDSIKTLPVSGFQKFKNSVLSLFSYNDWAKLTVILSLLAGLSWVFFFFSTLPIIKKLLFTTAILGSFICVFLFLITVTQYNRTTKTTFAIVFDDEVTIKNAPINSASQIFLLHKGTKVRVLDEVGEWQKIKIADGQVGWLLKKAIKTV